MVIDTITHVTLSTKNLCIGRCKYYILIICQPHLLLRTSWCQIYLIILAMSWWGKRLRGGLWNGPKIGNNQNWPHMCCDFMVLVIHSSLRKSDCKLSESWCKVASKMSHSFTLVGYPTINSHMCMAIIEKNTLVTSCLFNQYIKHLYLLRPILIL